MCTSKTLQRITKKDDEVIKEQEVKINVMKHKNYRINDSEKLQS